MSEEAEWPASGDQARMVRWLDRAEVLDMTVTQLRKDLAVGAQELGTPAADEGAFEVLRSDVFALLDRWHLSGAPDFSRAVNRIDLSERQVNAAMDHGGLQALAGSMVLRALQKVLYRLRHAGRF